MKKTKVFTSITAVILAAVLLFVTIVTINNNTKVANAETAKANIVRTISLKDTGIDYANFFNEFEDSELVIDEDNNALKFSGRQTLSAELFSEINLVSESNDTDGIDINYIFDYNANENEFILSIIADVENGAIVDNWFGVPFITKDNEIDIVFTTDDGIIYLSELEESGVLENCGWFSSLLKKVAVVATVVAVVATVVAVAVVAAPAVVAAATTVSTAVAVGGGTAALTAGTATAAVAAAAAAGTAAMATTTFAVATTTAAVATAIAAGVYIADQSLQLVDDATFSNPLKKVRILASSILSKIEEITLNKVYQFAYLDKSGLVVLPTKMNYIEAYGVLLSCGIINNSAVGVLSSELNNFTLSGTLATLVNTIKSKAVKAGYVGIYTISESDAAKLAYAAGGFFRGEAQSEVHDKTEGSGYYYHFHDFTHSIHVWYGNPF